jgi:hypothetical protein
MKGGVLVALLAGIVAVISCAQAPQTPQTSAAPTPAASADNGRFQLIVKPDVQGTTIAFLVDTRSGDTWVYRPPQGPIFNGFWSDVPRMNYPAQLWQQAFQILFSQATNPPATPPRTTGGNGGTGTTGATTGGGTPRTQNQ